MNHAFKFRSSYDSITAADVVALNETNDCVVRAFMNAASITYTEAHAIVATTFGRKPRQGTSGFITIMRQLIANNQPIIPGKTIHYLGKNISGNAFTKAQAAMQGLLINTRYPKGDNRFAAYTVGKFLAHHTTGSYILVVKGHALAIRDGLIYENADQLDHLFITTGRDQRRVIAAFKIS